MGEIDDDKSGEIEFDEFTALLQRADGGCSQARGVAMVVAVAVVVEVAVAVAAAAVVVVLVMEVVGVVVLE